MLAPVMAPTSPINDGSRRSWTRGTDFKVYLYVFFVIILHWCAKKSNCFALQQNDFYGIYHNVSD